MRRGINTLLVIVISIITILAACKKEEVPENPFDKIDRSVNNQQPTDPEPNSILGLHKNIFFPRCANPGCHDGTFEPDFRTIESTFYTLVYQPVNKVTLDSAKIYTHRVIPFNTADSWLIERLTTTTSEYMPSNGVRLSTSQIDHIKNWINAGCPDQNGVLPVKPNLQPNVIGYVAVDSVNTRLDTNRLNDFPFNPFIVQSGMTMTFLFVATDTADGVDGTDPSLFTKKEIRFSTDKNNFSGAVIIQATLYIAQFQGWVAYIPITSWPQGTTVYFRIYVNDGNHIADAEFPRNESLDYYKTLYSFYVQ